MKTVLLQPFVPDFHPPLVDLVVLLIPELQALPADPTGVYKYSFFKFKYTKF